VFASEALVWDYALQPCCVGEAEAAKSSEGGQGRSWEQPAGKMVWRQPTPRYLLRWVQPARSHWGMGRRHCWGVCLQEAKKASIGKVWGNANISSVLYSFIQSGWSAQTKEKTRVGGISLGGEKERSTKTMRGVGLTHLKIKRPSLHRRRKI